MIPKLHSKIMAFYVFFSFKGFKQTYMIKHSQYDVKVFKMNYSEITYNI